MRRSSIFFCAGIIAASCTACAANTPAPGTAAIELHGHRIGVEVAADNTSREHGLMDRTSMPDGHGMLFVFPDTAPRTFWMKNTLIPLDMLFFNDRLKLITLLRDVPPCKADPCPVYPSTAPARYVLELNAGAAVKLGARVGDAMKLDEVSTAAQ